jgi:deoxyribodipyrimidine photolyase
VYESNPKPSYAIVNQLIWREFFYVMATNNPFYGEIGNDYNFHQIIFFS